MADKAQRENAKSLISMHLLSNENRLTSKDIPEIVKEFQSVLLGELYQFNEADFEHLIKSLETQYFTTMGVGVSLIDTDVPHDEEWYLNHEINWEYWKDYKELLNYQGWRTRVLSSMDRVTDNILGLLKNPHEEGDWERRGLVIGHVQSGKTANYIGLIAKAADAGYKFIIVIAGIHNNLRTQTQERIDQGFIGRDSETKSLIGVGNIRRNRAMPVTVTTTESDFNRMVARRFGMELKSLNNTFILVIKKNVSTLSNLHDWLKRLNTRQGLEKIADIPMLLIDDEADHASVNTNKPELDPTRTNREIRNILNLFRKKCYVGYTATPFANIFIDPDDTNPVLGNNLFPEDFIYCLDAPTNYFGSEKVFLDEDDDSPFFREIDDAEEYIPLRHRKDDEIGDLPPSLKRAIRLFVLSRAIRNLRGQKNKHSSMMINVSRFVAIQQQIRQLTDIYVDTLKKAIRFNYKLEGALVDKVVSQLYSDFLDEYPDSDVVWEDVLAELNDAADAVKVFLVNSKSDEALDYTPYTKEGNALTAIAIGGLSLSRGLTIEGLTVSYIYRNSKMYDTLMQMGRWFGYRDNYEDLCRVFMSDRSYGWYSHIAEATEELRMQIKRMRREGKKPSDFGLYVRAHPDTLIVTAMNKMHHAENRAFQVSYDGKLIETHTIPESDQKNDSNRKLLNTFFRELRESEASEEKAESGTYLFRNASWERIQTFILEFEYHTDMSDLRDNIPKFVKEISDLHPDWDVAFHSLSGREPTRGFMIAAQIRDIGHEPSGQPRRPASESGWYVGNKNRFSGNNMFKIGLNIAELDKAEARAKDASRKRPIFSDYTDSRKKPLLILHILELVDKRRDKAENEHLVAANVPAISISFPNSREFRTVEYTVGKVWLKQFEQDWYDSVDEEDDYDLL